MASKFTEVVVDASNPEALAEFWCAVLEWKIVDADDSARVYEIAEAPGAKPCIVFVPVPEPKSVKNRVHIDVSPSRCDQSEEVERVLALGARRVDVGQGQQTWVVLADPEGNEFCVLQRRVD